MTGKRKAQRTAKQQDQRNWLADADILARFANLKESEVDEFRHSVAPDFVPKDFWELPRVWKMEQELLQDTWRRGFPLELSVLTMSHIMQFSDFGQSWDRLQKMSPAELEAATAKAKAGQTWIPSPKGYPYQNAVAFLMIESWRARVCDVCGKFFVVHYAGNNPKCSDECRIEAILRTKRMSKAKSMRGAN